MCAYGDGILYSLRVFECGDGVVSIVCARVVMGYCTVCVCFVYVDGVVSILCVLVVMGYCTVCVCLCVLMVWCPYCVRLW